MNKNNQQQKSETQSSSKQQVQQPEQTPTEGQSQQQNQQQRRAQAAQQRKEQQEEQRKSILQQILTKEASTRLNRISIVKPEKARKIEDGIIQMAMSGQSGRVDENVLINLLNQTSEKSTPKVTIKRRNVLDDSDDSDDEDWG
eukprot:gb/GECH01011816.1/.p1 GENE.gb/GECH01011816.1/~~gb/GECH01011816.1/.p1  ORF type:complete len:143 (+),score=61.03 gb/GECH01011816.1/:1-429(+)